MSVCPLISSGSEVMACHPACALRVGDECAFKIMAQTALSQQAKSNGASGKDTL